VGGGWWLGAAGPMRKPFLRRTASKGGSGRLSVDRDDGETDDGDKYKNVRGTRGHGRSWVVE